MAVSQAVVVFALCILLNGGNAQKSPTISYISQTQIKDVGGVVELACSVQYTTDYPVVWMKQDSSLPISSGSSLILHDSRFALKYDRSSSTYTLQIKDMQETDAGTYACSIIISTSSRVTATVDVQVRRPPFISDNSTRSVVVSEGQPVEMECYAGGYPTPRISWRRENNAILPTGGSIYRGNRLKIRSIRKEDRGTYYCVAENGVGKEARRNIAVEVEFAPVVTVPKPRLAQALQYDMDLECQVEAYPPPAITWKKDDFVLSNNQHYKISHFSTADQLTATTLRVITTEKKQYGEYVCEAGNKFGTSVGRVVLIESVIPVCPPACDSGRYGASSTLSTSTAALFISLFICIYRNVYAQR
ncbi:lachesin [Anthonomus grandis grandis]|uniref:lachesin n=1 Tax=Anthonomus grandis grandis TaxID=2921223 RepID=UPI002166BCCD|nr:lachesin [Anthonomus grandis grandis]